MSDALKRGLHGFDFFRTVPRELKDEATTTGGAVSLVSLVIISGLFMSEFFAYLTPKTRTNMYVDDPQDPTYSHLTETMRINVNLTTPAVPCALVGIDAQDVLGSHEADIVSHMMKFRTDEHGNLKLHPTSGQPLRSPDRPVGTQALEMKGEGCRLDGYIEVKKVPGNFHISAHTHYNMLTQFIGSNQLNVSHIVHHLSFGRQGDDTREEFQDAESSVNPLDGFRQVIPPGGSKVAAQQGHGHGHGAPAGQLESYEYFIKVVPTIYERANGHKMRSYQFSSATNSVKGRYELPAIYFRYDMSALTVHMSPDTTPFSHFIVQVMAIIGGMFTVFSLLSVTLNKGLQRIVKKAQQGKLG